MNAVYARVRSLDRTRLDRAGIVLASAALLVTFITAVWSPEQIIDPGIQLLVLTIIGILMVAGSVARDQHRAPIALSTTVAGVCALMLILVPAWGWALMVAASLLHVLLDVAWLKPASAER